MACTGLHGVNCETMRYGVRPRDILFIKAWTWRAVVSVLLRCRGEKRGVTFALPLLSCCSGTRVYSTRLAYYNSGTGLDLPRWFDEERPSSELEADGLSRNKTPSAQTGSSALDFKHCKTYHIKLWETPGLKEEKAAENFDCAVLQCLQDTAQTFSGNPV